MSYFLVIVLANIECNTYFQFTLNVLVAMMPLSNESKNNSIDMKKLSIVIMWLLPTKSFKSYFTTWCLCSPTPFLLLRFWPFASLMFVISLSLSLSSSYIVQIFLQYTSKFHKYFNNALATIHTIIPKNTGFLSMYYLIGQYLPSYMTMLSSTIDCWLDDHCFWNIPKLHQASTLFCEVYHM